MDSNFTILTLSFDRSTTWWDEDMVNNWYHIKASIEELNLRLMVQGYLVLADILSGLQPNEVKNQDYHDEEYKYRYGLIYELDKSFDPDIVVTKNNVMPNITVGFMVRTNIWEN